MKYGGNLIVDLLFETDKAVGPRVVVPRHTDVDSMVASLGRGVIETRSLVQFENCINVVLRCSRKFRMNSASVDEAG